MVYSYPRARTYVRRKTQCSKDKIKKQGEEKRREESEQTRSKEKDKRKHCRTSQRDSDETAQ
jgi:hypothetical protein